MVKPLTLLLVEDSESSREVYRRYLLGKNSGGTYAADSPVIYQLVEFETGAAALKWCQQQVPDLILLDYQLPDMNGLEFLEQVRQQPHCTDLPVVMLTALGNTKLAIDSLKQGVYDYLDKSWINADLLHQVIQRVLEQARLQRDLAWQQEKQHLIAAIALQICQSFTLSNVLDVAVREVHQFLKADRVLIYQFAPDMSGVAVAEALTSPWTSSLGICIRDTCFQTNLGGDYRQGRIWAMASIYDAGLSHCHLQLLEEFQVKANLVVPILVAQENQKLWGLLIAHQCLTPRQWSQPELDLLQQLAVQLAIAIQQAELYDRLQALNSNLEATVATQTAQLRENETRLQQLNQELEDRVFRRTSELQNVQERLQFIVSSSPGIVYTCKANSDFGATFMAGNISALMGYEASAFTNDSRFWIDRVHPEDQARVLQEFQRVSDQELHTCEYRFRHQDGSYRWIYDQYKLVRDQADNPLEIIGYWVDISDRKFFEAEILQNRDLREAIFNESADAIFLVNVETMLIMDCNRRAVELFEASSKAELLNIVGYSLRRHPIARDELILMQEAIRLKGYWSNEVEYVTRQGRPFWGNIAVKTIQVAGQEMSLVRVTDISQQQAALREREQVEAQIKASLEEKEILLKEIHHRVKNNMQIITSLLKLQASQIKEPGSQEIFKESQNRVRSMALVHEKLYQSSDLARTDFASYIQTLATELMRSYNVNPDTIQLITQLENVQLSIDLAIPCGLILNELISNALKYAFPNGTGEIRVECRTLEPNCYELVVQDNGVGFPTDLDWQHTSSLGLQLVSMLIQQLGGTVVLQHRPGTRFTITFSTG